VDPDVRSHLTLSLSQPAPEDIEGFPSAALREQRHAEVIVGVQAAEDRGGWRLHRNGRPSRAGPLPNRHCPSRGARLRSEVKLQNALVLRESLSYEPLGREEVAQILAGPRAVGTHFYSAGPKGPGFCQVPIWSLVSTQRAATMIVAADKAVASRRADFPLPAQPAKPAPASKAQGRHGR